MSQIGKKPYIETVLGLLSQEQLTTLKGLLSNIGSYTKKSLMGDALQLKPTDAGIYGVELRLTAGKVCRGILIYLLSDEETPSEITCTFLAINGDSCKSVGVVKINDLKDYTPMGTLTSTELRFQVEKFLDDEGGEAGGVVIRVLEDTTLTPPNPAWLVPKLTVAQVEQAYNALVAGKHCTIVNADETVFYTAVLSDVVTENANVLIMHCWEGFVDYQVTDHDTVDIVGHATGSQPVTRGHKLTVYITATEVPYGVELHYLDGEGHDKYFNTFEVGSNVINDVVAVFKLDYPTLFPLTNTGKVLVEGSITDFAPNVEDQMLLSDCQTHLEA